MGKCMSSERVCASASDGAHACSNELVNRLNLGEIEENGRKKKRKNERVETFMFIRITFISIESQN